MTFYKEDVKAVFKNSFCMDSDCIHHIENSCLLCLLSTNDTIFPDSTAFLEKRDSKLCKQFVRGCHLSYVIDDWGYDEGVNNREKSQDNHEIG